MSNQNNSGSGYFKLPTNHTLLLENEDRTMVNPAISNVTLMAPTATLDTAYTRKPALKRYSASFRSLIPIRKKPRTAERLPVDKIGLLSMISFHWVLPFLYKAKKSLSAQTVSSDDSSKKMGERFYNLQWKAVVDRGRDVFSMTYVLWKFIQTRALVSSFLYIIGTTVQIIGLMSFIITINSTASSSSNVTKELDSNGSLIINSNATKTTSVNIYTVVAYCLAEFFSAIFLSWCWSLNYRTAIRAQSAVMYFLYKRMMVTSCVNLISTQQISRFCGIDSQKLFSAVLYTPLVMSAPIIFIGSSCGILALSFSWKSVSWLLPLGLISFIVISIIAEARALSESKASQLSSKRVSELHDMLLNIKLVKMVQWDNTVLNNFKELRIAELRYIKESYIWQTIGISLVYIIPIISASTLLLFRDPSIAPSFMVLGALVLAFIPLKTSLHNFWQGLSFIQFAHVSLRRLKETEILPAVKLNVNRGIDQQVAVSINKVSCKWEPKADLLPNKEKMKNNSTKWGFGMLRSRTEESQTVNTGKMVLDNISLIAEKGHVIGICGESGSGKTALLMAILGQLQTVSGLITKNGFCAYVNQKPWIWDATLRDNIVFMDEFKHDRYYNAIYSCLLSGVLQSLPGGDETIIGNEVLSMGVQQRVELARAIYSNREIYLIDEPLTMVDPNTRRNVFEKAILTALSGKTMFIATRHTMFLTRCDNIYVLKDGKIVGSGRHEELINTCEYYEDLLMRYMDDTHNFQGLQSYGSISTLSSDVLKASSTVNGSLSSIATACDDEATALTGAGQDSEEILSQDSFSNYLHFWKQRGSSISLACGLLMQSICFLSISAVPLLFILKFEERGFLTTNPDIFYGIVASITIIICMAFHGSSFAFVKVTEDISNELSNSWMEKICNTYITFIQKETATVILNWFSLHLYSIDIFVPQSLISFAGNMILLISMLSLLTYTFIWVVLPIIVVGFLGVFSYRIYLSALPNFHKLETETLSNLNTSMTSTVDGRTTVQSYSKENDFIHSFVRQCDQRAASIYLLKGANGCVSFWMAMLKVLLLSLTILMIALMRNHGELFIAHHKITPITAGFTFICINLLGSVIQYLIEDAAEFFWHFKYFRVNSKLQNADLVPTNTKSSYTWPEEGSILFQNVKLKFWPPDHKALSFKIKSNQKIGVIGYPDAGRKSIGTALFHLVELAEGRVCIGGINIDKIPLSVLRSKIAIIPHKPVLFRGTIWSNLLSTNDSSTCNMYEVLETVGMREKIEGLPQKANTFVQTDATLFTTGELQLLYLARAILNKPKILIVEEPFEPVSKQIHQKLQEIIETVFHRTTVLVIAQHFKYVEYCDKLLIIKDGQVVEYDTPTKLIRNPRSALSAMITETEL